MESVNQFFFFSSRRVHIVKLKSLHTKSQAVHNNDQKGATLAVQVNMMLAAVS